MFLDSIPTEIPSRVMPSTSEDMHRKNTVICQYHIKALYATSLYLGVFIATTTQAVAAQKFDPVTKDIQTLNRKSKLIADPAWLISSNKKIRTPPSQLPPPPPLTPSPSTPLQFQAPPPEPPSPPAGTETVPLTNIESPQLSRYRLGPGDAISVIVQRFSDLSFQASINPEGNIVVPLVGTISVQGLTLEEAQEKIRIALDRYVISPSVVVSLAAQRPVQVTITGEIVRPGIYPIGSGTPRIGDAILVSGGSTMLADLRQVQIRRTLVDGSIVSQNIDLYTPLQNGGQFPNLRLQDGDAIIVPRREVATDASYDRNLVARSSLAQQQIRIRILNYSVSGIATVPLANGSTFIDALSGINVDSANLREIALIRFDPERGKAVTRRLDGKKALMGDASQNVALQDNDVIIVGRNLIGRISNAISTITRPFFDIQSFTRFFDFFGN
jgi:protein involved in polysaccharide export with SLBB domain